MPAELAWGINLPLQESYEFVGFLCIQTEKMMEKFLKELGLYFCTFGYQNGERCINAFHFLIISYRGCNAIGYT
nr:hypothetical protein [Campylobacter jejuni]